MGGYGYSEESEEPSKPPVEVPVPDTYEKGEVTKEVDTSAGLDPYRRMDWERVPEFHDTQLIAQKLRRMVATVDQSKYRNTSTGSRLNIGSAITGQHDAFRTYTGRKGKRRVCVLMDMSGSMSALFARHGAQFLDALLILDRQGVLDCDIYLSGSHRCYKLPKNTTHDTVAELAAHGNVESIDATLKKAHADVVDADTVLIYTDGCLTDGNVKAGDWRSRGVDLIGVMTCVDDHREHFRSKMEENFHKAIITDDGVTLASAICQYILTRP